MFIPEYALEAIKIMQTNGYKLYPIGGCVRNHLMGIEPDDYDMTTDALPTQTLNAFSSYTTFDAGIKHGTVSVVIDKKVIEITTHRVDLGYADNRHPDSVAFTRKLTEDLGRRDFTMNAIAYDPETTEFIDPYNGIKDINNSLIRAVGNAEVRFNEDALRILRALRFASVLGFDIEAETDKAIHRCKELLKNVSVERIYTEFTKLLCGKNVRKVLRDYADVVCEFIPEIAPTIGFDQQNPHHCYDIYEHTLVTVESIEPDPILRWAMLLHDLGKPGTFFTDEKGGHFFGHYKNSADIARTVLTRLKASNATVNKVTELVYHHDSVIPETPKSVKRLLMKLGYDAAHELFKVNRADAKGQASHQLSERLLHIDKLEEIANTVIDEDQCFSIKALNINGNDIIALGIPKGKRIGDILATLLDEVIGGELDNTKDALSKRALELK